jgi:hypothetical protein
VDVAGGGDVVVLATARFRLDTNTIRSAHVVVVDHAASIDPPVGYRVRVTPSGSGGLRVVEGGGTFSIAQITGA